MNNRLTPLFSMKEVDNWFTIFTDRAEEKMYLTLQRAGETFVRYARLYGNYKDHTGNLRSSIGYVIVENGDIVKDNFTPSTKPGTDKATGLREAKKLARKLANTYNNGMVLICVAGMNYAAYVEAIDSLDVITAAGIKAEDDLRKQISKIFSRAKQHGRI